MDGCQGLCFDIPCGYFGHNELYMMTPHLFWIPPWSQQTHTSSAHTHKHIHKHTQRQSMVINLISDKPDTCTHEAFGHYVSLDHCLCNAHTHTYRFLHTHTHTLLHFFLSLTQLSRTSLTPDPTSLGGVIDFSSDPLNLGWREVRSGELVATVRCNRADAEDEGERSMQADGWAYSSRNNSHP